MFSNLTLYRFGAPAGAEITFDQLLQMAEAETFEPCAATQSKSGGWVPPRGQEHGALVEAVDGHWLLKYRIDKKTVPGSVVREEVNKVAAEIERSQGRKPGKKEMRDLRDDATIKLLAQAFVKSTAINVWFDPGRGRLIMDASSAGKCDDVITSIVRGLLGKIEIGMLNANESPTACMSHWLVSDDPPEAFTVLQECELKGTGEQPATIRYKQHSVMIEEVRQHIQEGKLPKSLALNYEGRVSFVLDSSFVLKKVRFEDGVLDGQENREADDAFDANVALSTGELGPMIDALLDALGGEAQAVGGETGNRDED